MNAKKKPIDADGALKLARRVKKIVATKGKKLIEIEITPDTPSDDEIRLLIVGPSGKLRAPTLRVGNTLLVGFDESMYKLN